MFHATHVSLGRVRVLRKVRISWKTVNAWKLTWKVRSWESKKLVTTSFAITAGSFSRHEYYLLFVHCISITYARIPIEGETFDTFALSFFFLSFNDLLTSSAYFPRTVYRYYSEEMCLVPSISILESYICICELYTFITTILTSRG